MTDKRCGEELNVTRYKSFSAFNERTRSGISISRLKRDLFVRALIELPLAPSRKFSHGQTATLSLARRSQ
jgi:hypothetical protein